MQNFDVQNLLKGTMLKTMIVLALGVVILGAATFYCVKLSNDIAVLESDNSTLQDRLDVLSEKSLKKYQLIQELNELQIEGDAFDRKFPDTIIQEDTIRKIKELETQSGCVVRRMSYQMLQADVPETTDTDATGNVHASPSEEVTDIAGLTDDKFQDMDPNNTAMAPQSGGIKMPVEISFESSFNEMKRFLTLVATSEQKMGMHEIRLSMGENTTGTIQIEFYGYKSPEESVKID